MPVNWMDVSQVSINSLLLLEAVQISWFPGWLPERELAVVLRANPVIEWYFRNKCPQVNAWLDSVMAKGEDSFTTDPKKIRQAENALLESANDLIVYVVDPQVYDTQPFLDWDSNELLSLADFSQKIVLDIGSGTGRLAFAAASLAKVVFAVEPVWNLRRFLVQKAERLGIDNLYAVDGIITKIPFPDAFADIVMGGHVFGDDPPEELSELIRVTRPGGRVILLPGNNDIDNEIHHFLVQQGFEWAVFIEPPDDRVRKYWFSKSKD